MANKKFSDFVLGTTVSDIDFVVGYKDLDNIQIAPIQLDSTYDLSLALVNPGVVEVTLGGQGGPTSGSQSQITLAAGNNIEFSVLGPVLQIDNPVVNKIIIAGTFHNIFGGDPGIFGDTLEFGIQALPLSDSSSVLSVPFNCKIVGASIKWISSDAAAITAGNSYQVKLYKMNNNSGKTTDASNYDFVGDFSGLSLDSSDNGGYPYKTSTTEFTLSAGDIINVSGVETGSILSSDAEMEMSIVIQPI